MSGFGLLMTVLAAVGWSSLDVIRKLLVARIDPRVILVVMSFGQVPGFAAWAASQGRFVDGPSYLPWGLAGIGLNTLANIAYLLAVRSSPLSLVIPLLAFVPVFTVLAANPVLGELPTRLQLLGIVTVVVGALVLHAPRDAPPRRWLAALLEERGALFMLITALCWAMAIVVDKKALAYSSPGGHALVMNAGIGVVVVVWMLVTRELGELRKASEAGGLLALTVVAGGVGLAAQLTAIAVLLTGVVEAIKRAIGMFASVIVGRIGFAEPITVKKVVAVVLMAAGAAAILIPR